MSCLGLALVLAVSVGVSCKSKEHPGDVAPSENGAVEGDPHKSHEHAGEEHPGDQSGIFTADQIKTAMKNHIENQTKNHDGLFLIHDPQAENKLLQLKFVKIHDPVREIKGKGFFACTDFEVNGEAGKLYDLDFWLNPKEGKLEVTQTQIHKEPRAEAGKWTKWARYTFENDEPVAVR